MILRYLRWGLLIQSAERITGTADFDPKSSRGRLERIVVSIEEVVVKNEG
jgi:hypothetical protein